MQPVKYESVPARFKQLISQDEYLEILELCEDYLSDKGQITSLESGEVCLEDAFRRKIKIGLDNLIRAVSIEDNKNWRSLVENHFGKFFDESSDEVDISDFNKIKDFLCLKVYPCNQLDQALDLANLIYRVDFEDTKTILTFDFPSQFRSVQKSEFEHWGLSVDDVLAKAVQNVNKLEVRVIGLEMEPGCEIFTFLSGYYSVSYLLDLANNAGNTIGKFGSIVNIPARSLAFVQPLNDIDFINTVGDIAEMVDNIYQHEPGPISRNFYWYYKGVFKKFPLSINNEGLATLMVPIELELLVRNS
ncbi:MAG: hypothetical protein WCO63_01465 [Bacteroidota bacterium]